MRLAAVDAELAELGHTDKAHEHREAMDQLHQRFERRSKALAAAHDAAVALRRFSSPVELLIHAPLELADGTPFRRVLLSVIRDASLLPVAAYFNTGHDSQVEADPDSDADRASDVLAQLREMPTTSHAQPGRIRRRA